MRQSKIVRAIPLDLLTQDNYDAARKDLAHKSFEYDGTSFPNDYNLSLIRNAQEIINSGEFYLQMDGGRPPGQPFNIAPPVVSNMIYPSLFAKPFQYRYSAVDPKAESSNGGGVNWIGQNSYGVKRYEKFYRDESDTAALKNSYFFEHEDELYMLSESRVTLGDRVRVFVTLHKRVGDNFSEVKRFTEQAVDSFDFQDAIYFLFSSLQTGSPCGVSVDGQMYIYFRYYDRSASASYIICFKGSETELVESSRTKIVSSLVPEDRPTGLYDVSYRLRVAYGEGIFMIVSYGVGALNLDKPGSDFRMMLSYDKCSSFVSHTNSASGVLLGNQINDITEKTDLFFMIPSLTNNNLVNNNSVSISTAFTLHYDISIASFVLLKAGYPDAFLNVVYRFGNYIDTKSNHLIALVASISNPYNWELAARYKLSESRIAVGKPPVSPDVFDIDSFNEDDGINAEGIYIADMCVISNGIEHYLYMSSGGQIGDYGNSLTKFCFAHSKYMPRSVEGNVIAFGQKVHKNFVFIMDPINTQSTGYAHGATDPLYKQPIAERTPIRWEELVGCFWRNRIVLSAKMTETSLEEGGDPAPLEDGGADILYGPIFNRYTSLAILGDHSNLAEEHAYEFSYSKRFRAPEGFNLVDAGPGSKLYDTNNEVMNYTNTAIYSAITNDTVYPSIAQRIQLKRVPKFKTRFQLRLNSATVGGNFKFFSAKLSSYLESEVPGQRAFIDIGARISSSGVVTLTTDDSGSASNNEIMGILNLQQTYDIAIMVETGFRSNRRYSGILYFSYKKIDDELWTVTEYEQDVFFTTAAPLVEFGQIRYGLISSNPGGDAVVGIGDIMISSYGSGYKRQFVDYDIGSMARERLYGSNTMVYERSRPATSYSQDMHVYDGKIRMVNFSSNGFRVNRFNLQDVRQRNSIKNLVSENADLVYLLRPSELPTETFLFKINDYALIENISLLNVAGISSVSISSGKYDSASENWLTKVTTTFPWKTEELTRLDYRDKTLTVEEDLSSHELYARFLHIYNGASLVEQVEVLDNIENMIFVSFSATLSNNYIPKIANKHCSFDVTIANDHTHLEIIITKVSNAKCYIGRIMFGESTELSECVTSVDQSIYTSDNVNITSTGYSYNSYDDIVSISDELSVTIPRMTVDQPYFSDVLNVINDIKRTLQPVLFINTSQDYENIYYGPISDVSVNQSGREFDLSLKISSNTTTAKVYDYVSKNWTTSFSTGPDSVVFEVTEFTANTADASGLSISHEWDFGDGNTQFGESVSHTYLEPGIYEVTLSSTDQFNTTKTYKRELTVTNIAISDYFINATGGPVNYTLTINAIDKNGTTVDDDSTILYIIAPVISTVRLINGMATVVVVSAPASSVRLAFTDSLSRTWIKRVFT